MSLSTSRKPTGDRPAIVLLAEDNETDVELTRLAFEQGKYPVQLHVAVDGEDCLAFLEKQGRYTDAPTPDIVLLDLHMPRMNGLEVLERLSRPATAPQVPIIVLTTSDSDRDIDAAYRLRCNGYVIKPVGFANFLEVIRVLQAYWFDLVELPQRPPAH